MKILKYLLYAILLLIVLFFAAGLFTSSISYGYQIEVDKPVEEAWAVSHDESKYADWLKGFTSLELLEGEKFAVGSKYKVVVTPYEGKPGFEMIETITSIKENDHITMEFDSDYNKFIQTITFSEDEGTTTVKTDSKVLGNGIMYRSLYATMHMLGDVFTKQEAENLENLKVLIQENTTDYFPEPVELDSIPAVPEEMTEEG